MRNVTWIVPLSNFRQEESPIWSLSPRGFGESLGREGEPCHMMTMVVSGSMREISSVKWQQPPAWLPSDAEPFDRKNDQNSKLLDKA